MILPYFVEKPRPGLHQDLVDYLDFEGAIAHRGAPVIRHVRWQMVNLVEFQRWHLLVPLHLRHRLRRWYVGVVVEPQDDNARTVLEAALNCLEKHDVQEHGPCFHIVCFHQLHLAVDEDCVGTQLRHQRLGKRIGTLVFENLDEVGVYCHLHTGFLLVASIAFFFLTSRNTRE
jgi:hypothetical protein